jgi:hypothetical protein
MQKQKEKRMKKLKMGQAVTECVFVIRECAKSEFTECDEQGVVADYARAFGLNAEELYELVHAELALGGQI